MKIAIIFPGIGYTSDKPLLYYGLDVACDAGFEEYRKLQYTPQKKENIRGNAEAMERAFYELYAQAKEQLADVRWEEYEEVLFISKSIGTIIATAYAKEKNIAKVRHVLYTPLKNTYDFDARNAIAFIGTADAWSDYKEVVRLSEEAGIPIEIYEDCNHSLETKDTFRNIAILQKVMDKTKSFLMCCLIAFLVTTFTACGRSADVEKAGIIALSEEISQAVAEDQFGVTESLSEEQTEETSPEETEEVLQNAFFSVRLLSREKNDDNNIILVFEFTNITDETYYKNDEEIVPGGTWTKTIFDKEEAWVKAIGRSNWLHYKLYDNDRNELFAGGMVFTMDEDLQVTGMEIFEDVPIEK